MKKIIALAIVLGFACSPYASRLIAAATSATTTTDKELAQANADLTKANAQAAAAKKIRDDAAAKAKAASDALNAQINASVAKTVASKSIQTDSKEALDKCQAQIDAANAFIKQNQATTYDGVTPQIAADWKMHSTNMVNIAINGVVSDKGIVKQAKDTQNALITMKMLKPSTPTAQ